jgi:L-ascorbate metabolism protein UlaG (beta-lactamase superfamily)
MLKTLFFIILALANYKVEAAVTAKWLTVSSIVIDDGKTRLLFDPAWTRPGLKHWLNLSQFKSDEDLVKSILQTNALERIDAVFASHSHFDHVMDAPMVSKLAGAVFYVDESSERIANAYQEKKIRTIKIFPKQTIRVGDFVITPLPRMHSQILHLFDFLPGQVPKDTNLSFWDYHVGDTWFYLIQHPEITILLDQGSEPNMDTLKPFAQKVDVVFQGIANRKNDEKIIDGYVKELKARQFIPLHFDNFFADFSAGEEGLLPGIRIDALLEKMKKAHPAVSVDRPLYGKPITLLKVE